MQACTFLIILTLLLHHHCHQTIETAVRAGLNYVDTSPFYGEGKSEEVLGMITSTMSVMMMMMEMVAVLIMIYSLNRECLEKNSPRDILHWHKGS